MRQIVLDTETTGLEPSQGHRIIELGCVELVNRRLTDRRFHEYVCPEREIDSAAVEVHGITVEFLSDKPRFVEVVSEFMAFVEGAEVIIHNAPFDVAFIDHELRLLDGGWGHFGEHCRVMDSLALARQRHPGQKNSLDALCKRYGVDNSRRDLHGALLDAEILADVYLALTGGQASLDLGSAQVTAPNGDRHRAKRRHDPLPVLRATREELSLHQEQIEAIDRASGGQCLWKRLELPSG